MNPTRLEVDGATTIVQVDAEQLAVTTPQRTLVVTLDPLDLTLRPGPPEVVGVALPGPPGLNGGNFVYEQSVPASTWTIVHGLGFSPGGIRIIDTLGRDVIGEVSYPDLDTVSIVFNATFSGTAYLS